MLSSPFEQTFTVNGVLPCFLAQSFTTRLASSLHSRGRSDEREATTGFANARCVERRVALVA